MIGKQLRKLRLERDMTQAELAKKINVSPRTISFYESDDRDPDNQMLTNIANYFGVSVDYLLGRDMSRSPKKYLVPVFSAVACGNPLIADEDIIDFEELDPKLENQGEFYGLKLRGSSMEPKFSDGDVVIVKRQDDVDNGDIVEYQGKHLVNDTQFYQKIYYPALDKAGIKRKIPYSCRYTFATIAYYSGVNEKAIQKLMGHTDLKITQEFYIQDKENMAEFLFDELKKI